jgi:NADH-quinone oxidoreductase subunit J
MLEALLANLDTILLVVFGVSALVGGVLVIVLRQPMRVAMALISTMVFLGGIYGLLGVHFIAAFQVLIYVGAVMVFMVYVIMLLDVRDPAFLERYGRAVVPSVAVAAVLSVALGAAVGRGRIMSADDLAGLHSNSLAATFEVQPFSVEFLERYWLHFELTSVLLLAAVVAAIAVIKAGRRHDG